MSFSLQITTAAEKAAQAKAAATDALATLRWQREEAGITLPGGGAIATTRQSQAQITSVIKSLELGLITEPVAWKLASGWADLTAAQINAAAAAVAAHVQACFVAERAVSQQIEAAADPASIDITTAFDTAYGAAIAA
ncbi:MAG: DUF4376 domain-containing protein [Paracoccaceae bacterium]